MRKLIITVLIVFLPILCIANPKKDTERKSKRDYMTAKATYEASPTEGNYNKMIKARQDMATEVIKYRKERKQK